MSFSKLPDWLLAPDLAIPVWLPLVLAAAATGFLRLLGGRDLGTRIASGGAAAGFVLAYTTIIASRGLFAPATLALTENKPLALALIGLSIGILLDAEQWGGRWQRPLVVMMGLGALAWVAGPAVTDSQPGPGRNLVIAYLAAATMVFVRTTRVTGSAVTAPIQLCVAAIGIGAVAWVSGTASLFHLSLGLGAAVAGFLAWNWPSFRFPPGAALVLGAGVPLLALGGELLLYEDGPRLALGALLLVFFSEWIAGQFPLGGSSGGKAMRPIVVACIGLAVVAAATLLARWETGQPLPFLPLGL